MTDPDLFAALDAAGDPMSDEDPLQGGNGSGTEPQTVPPGTYAGEGRSPIAWVYLCPPCGGYPALAGLDYCGALSGQCQGCGSWTSEIHRFPAVIDSASGCNCRTEHAQRVGDLHAVNH